MNVKESLTKDILMTLATGAAIFLILSSPSGARRLIKEIKFERRKKKLKEQYEEKRLKEKFYYLRQKKLIDFRQEGDAVKIVLTEEGNRQVLKYRFDNVLVEKPKRWDGKWRLVFFDIPEDKKNARDALRKKLEEMGFLRFNNSVWVYPYECQREIDFVSEFFNIGDFVHCATVTRITNESALKLKFGL